MSGWALCVLLSARVLDTPDCTALYPLESQCWDAGWDWTQRAIAWSRRSHLPLAAFATCIPASELNAFKRDLQNSHTAR